jgi:uncharacterized protein YndB with AHSA1/START domain
MKHLKVLEEANLIVHQWEGKFKHFYFNTIPIQMIYDRWLNEYTKYFSFQLTGLKYMLETEDSMSDYQDKQVYVLYIRTTKEKVWEAITSPDITQKYFFNSRVQSDFQHGSEISYHMDTAEGNERIPVKGKILKIEKYKELVHTFQHDFGENQKGYSQESRVTYQIEEMGELVKLTLIHDEFKGDQETSQSVSGGWPIIINGLKTFLETGMPLVFPSDN